MTTLWIVACSIGTATLAGLAVVYRRAAARRELEVVDELLGDEFRALARSSLYATSRRDLPAEPSPCVRHRSDG